MTTTVPISSLEEARYITLDHLRTYMARVGWREYRTDVYLHDEFPSAFYVQGDLWYLVGNLAELEKRPVQQLLREMAAPSPAAVSDLLAAAGRASALEQLAAMAHLVRHTCEPAHITKHRPACARCTIQSLLDDPQGDPRV